eukprot:403343860
MSKSISAVSKVVNQQALEAITQKLSNNVWAAPSRTNPNAAKLVDGAIQRQSVVPDSELLHPSVNTDKVGYYKRPQNDETSSGSAFIQSTIWETKFAQNKIARIYHPQKKHTHNHPTNKLTGNHWVIEFQPNSQYKSSLMSWTSATTDPFHKTRMVVGSLSAAVKYCETMGWGYDVTYQQTRWHTKKNYADNFAWKGKAPEEQPYD